MYLKETLYRNEMRFVDAKKYFDHTVIIGFLTNLWGTITSRFKR